MAEPIFKRVITYIDGFNLYYGLRAAGYKRYYWLDMTALGRNLLKPGQTLVETKYFTARIAGPRPADTPQKAVRLQDKRQRQAAYLDALSTLRDYQMFEGRYLPKNKRCFECNAQWTQHEEKQTDVNIATELLVDAFQDTFDIALLISGDSDLTPPVAKIKLLFPLKQVIIAFPPKRHSAELRKSADGSFTIGRDRLRDSQLPDSITLPDGHILSRPTEWR